MPPEPVSERVAERTPIAAPPRARRSLARVRLVRLGWGARVLGAGSLGAGLAAGLYVAAFAALVPRPAVPFIKELVLAHAPGPRLIVDSGSNAVFGLDVAALGRALNRLGFIVSDNGNVNPIHKAFRLERFARPGDLVVLPFEWLHYDVPEQLSLAYIEAATGPLLPAYFHALPWRERARLVAALPLGTAARIMWRNAADALRVWRGDADPAREAEGLHLVLTAGWDGGAPPRPAALLPEAASNTCAGYTLPPGQLLRGPNRDGVRRMLAPLRRLQARGARVVFIPPVVAGGDCYADAGRVGAYVDALKRLLAEAGLSYLGDPAALWFGPEAVTDTHYHVALSARAAATERVTAWLLAAGLAAPAPPREGATAALVALERSLNKRRWPGHPLPLGRETPADSPDLLAAAGWWGPEAGGRWSRGGEAVLRLRVEPGTRSLVLRLRSFAEARRLEVLVDGGLAAVVPVGTEGGFADIPLPPGMGRVELTLRPSGFPPPRSPRDFGAGDDPRTLGYHLMGVTPRD